MEEVEKSNKYQIDIKDKKKLDEREEAMRIHNYNLEKAKKEEEKARQEREEKD